MLSIPTEVPAHEWVDTQDRAVEILQEAMKRPYVAVDTEGTGLDKIRDHLNVWSLAYPGHRFCLSSRVLHAFKPLFENPDIIMAMQNGKHDMHMFANAGITVEAKVHDTLVMSKMDNTERSGHGLKYLASDGLFGKEDPRYIAYEEPFGGKIKNYRDLEKSIGPEGAQQYSSLDAISTLYVYEELKKRLKIAEAWKGQNLWDYFVEKEVPFTRTLFNCERRGIYVDIGYLSEKAAIAEKKLEGIEESFCRAAGRPINLNSPKQLREFFYDDMGKEPISYTSGGASGNKQPSLDEKTLKTWAKHGDPHAITLMEHRKLGKLYGTYLKGLLKGAGDTCKVHTTLKQYGARTGRLASEDPNMQQIPRPSGDVYGIRHAFVAPPGRMLIDSDYDQLEMKLLADFSEEEVMINAINSGKDLHSATAALMYGKDYDAIIEAIRKKDAKEPLSDVDKELCRLRQASKATGFGLNYGQGDKKLAEQLGISVREAKELKALYFKPYPKVSSFIEETHAYITEYGLARSMVGRPRHLTNGVGADDEWAYFEALRQGLNHCIQGSAADVVREAMVLCDNDRRLQELDCWLVLQIHDELVFDCNEETVLEAEPIIQELMVTPFKEDLTVKLTAAPHHGRTWAEAK